MSELDAEIKDRTTKIVSAVFILAVLAAKTARTATLATTAVWQSAFNIDQRLSLVKHTR